MTAPFGPLFGLRVHTERLELRLPTQADLDAVSDLSFQGIHDPMVQPFSEGWTDAAPEERARGTMQYHWSKWAAWRASDWTLTLVAAKDDVVVGTQEMRGRDFNVLREVSSGSWLGREYQGQGIGTEMRAAVLHLAFVGLGAEYATSLASEDNVASLSVSRKFGYDSDGIERRCVRGRPAVFRRLRLDRRTWEDRQLHPVTIEGLDSCLPYFGLE